MWPSRGTPVCHDDSEIRSQNNAFEFPCFIRLPFYKLSKYITNGEFILIAELPAPVTDDVIKQNGP